MFQLLGGSLHFESELSTEASSGASERARLYETAVHSCATVSNLGLGRTMPAASCEPRSTLDFPPLPTREMQTKVTETSSQRIVSSQPDIPGYLDSLVNGPENVIVQFIEKQFLMEELQISLSAENLTDSIGKALLERLVKIIQQQSA